MTIDFSKYSDNELYSFIVNSPEYKDRAFAEIYSRYSTQVFRYCTKMINEKSKRDDVFQDTFLKFLRYANKEREMTNLLSYLLKISRNLCFDANKKQEYQIVSIEDVTISIQNYDNDSKELQNLVNMALDLIPEDQREAFILQTYNDMSYNEIAEIMNVPLTTVRNWIVRSKRRIREILLPYLDEVK